MAEDLTLLVNELRIIRSYLIKIGPSRREGKILERKKEEAKCIFHKFNSLIDIYNAQLKSDESYKYISLISKINEEFNSLYSEILKLCSKEIKGGKFSPQSDIMADTFELKVALSLLPVANDEVSSLKHLIEGIEYYGSILSNAECKNKLVNFVLKTRLSQNAKLKLCPNYESLDSLLKDMRKCLLPQKSSTAIQTKLQQAYQHEKSVVEFGKEITDLFVDLTISQADGDQNAYNILRPLNEKYAIRRFADGLRSRRLSLIVAARNFTSLKDAIQSAQDEEITTSQTAEVMGIHRNPNSFNSDFNRNSVTSRGRYNNHRRFYIPVARGRGYPTQQQQPQSNGYRPRAAYQRGSRQFSRGYRGRSLPKHNRGTRNHINIMHSDSNSTDANDTDHPHAESLNHFFRA